MWLRALEAISGVNQQSTATFGAILNDLAVTYGGRPALIDSAGTMSYRDLSARANRYARWAQAEGLAPGAVVGLLMPNCAEYVAAWAGLSQVGCVVALINTNLTHHSLAHAITIADCRAVIVESSLYGAFAAADIKGVACWIFGASAGGDWPRIDQALAHYNGSQSNFKDSTRPACNDRALLIYTSGTTGLPKAVNVSHARMLQWAYWFAGLMETGPDDRLYNCLPMYHSTGGVSSIGALLVRGGSVVIRPRFSSQRFWDDVVDTGCTIFQYIGEVCRYLLSAPPHPLETRHRLRLCCGNGLREEVWQAFKERFKIPKILEFYAATEGVISLYNCEGKPGAIGRIPGFLAHRFPLALVKCDHETAELTRNDASFCVPCNTGEIGEALGQLNPESWSPARRFEGYTNPETSERKLARDVFRPGDLWYRTGDLMRRDADGFFYFVDRLGDAFRWKGENVAASEVASVIAVCPGIVDAVVYGVQVQGCEGRAGMAAIAVDGDFSLSALWRHIHEKLPPYARPVFVRVCGEIDVTGTFKLSAGRLAKEGYRLASESGRVLFDHRVQQAYVACNAELLTQIEDGTIQL